MLEMAFQWAGETALLGLIGFVFAGGLLSVFEQSDIAFETYRFHKKMQSNWSIVWLVGLWSAIFQFAIATYNEYFYDIQGNFNSWFALFGAMVWYWIGKIKK